MNNEIKKKISKKKKRQHQPALTFSTHDLDY